MSATTGPALREMYTSMFEELKNGLFKNMSIIRSTSASVSLLASLILVWILNRSLSRFTTTYHRLILMLSASDILLSLSFITFNLIVPEDFGYVVWNARGNLATCNAFGFLTTWGFWTSPMSSASLTLYYLAKIKYKKPDWYIARKLEPALIAVPMLLGLVTSIIYAAQEVINVDLDGACGPWPYNPPHCEDLEDGQIPDGFEIPCGRGNSFYKGSGSILVYAYVVMAVFLVPITIGGSLFMIYRSIASQEQRMARYGVTNQNSSQSSAVSRRAADYAISYFVTWFWVILYFIVNLAGAWPSNFPLPTWTVAYNYLWSFFVPLQGLWTFLIFIHPKVTHVKSTSDQEISWFVAFLDALCLATTGKTRSQCLCRKRSDSATQGNQETAVTSGVGGANATTPGGRRTDASPAAEETTATEGGVNTESSVQAGGNGEA